MDPPSTVSSASPSLSNPLPRLKKVVRIMFLLIIVFALFDQFFSSVHGPMQDTRTYVRDIGYKNDASRTSDAIYFRPSISGSRMSHSSATEGRDELNLTAEVTVPSPVPLPRLIDKENKRKERTHRRLEFVHIPKTGGSSIEVAAGRAGIPWALCHWGHKSCEKFAKTSRMSNRPKWEVSTALRTFKVQFRGSGWHLPPYFFFGLNGQNITFLAQNRQKTTLKEFSPLAAGENMYKDSDLFVVVRNVYSRLISQYYFAHSARYVKNITEVGYFNKWVSSTLGRYLESMGNYTQVDSPWMWQNEDYWMQDWHLVPQYHYVYQVEGRSGHMAGLSSQHFGSRLVKHILRFEDLTVEFSELMKEYNLSHVQLPHKKIYATGTTNKLTPHNLSLANLALINGIYQRDFEEFGYKQISRENREQL